MGNNVLMQTAKVFNFLATVPGFKMKFLNVI